VADISEHMKIIGKDGAPVGTVDRVEGTRIKLTKKDSPQGTKTTWSPATKLDRSQKKARRARILQ
jgi:hypothetical protein